MNDLDSLTDADAEHSRLGRRPRPKLLIRLAARAGGDFYPRPFARTAGATDVEWEEASGGEAVQRIGSCAGTTCRTSPTGVPTSPPSSTSTRGHAPWQYDKVGGLRTRGEH